MLDMEPKDIPLRDRIIFALDVETPDEARSWVKTLEGSIGFYKVGLELFLAGGFPIVEWIKTRGHKVFLDLKFFDVPNTVMKAVRQLRGRGIDFATVHGNTSIVRAAASAKGEVKILAVTVLTSLSGEDAREFGLAGTLSDLVLERATAAVSLGCDGVVASGQEAAMLRASLDKDFFIITPGIRFKDSTEDDQRRTVTPEEAFANGTDYIVMGRPIRMAERPLDLVLSIQAGIQKGLKKNTNSRSKDNARNAHA